MFKLANKYTVSRSFPKCGSFRYTPKSFSVVKYENEKFYIDLSRENSDNSLNDSNLESDSELKYIAANVLCAKGNHIGLVGLRLIALFCIYNLSSSSGKDLANISNTHVSCLLYKRLKSSKDSF